MCVVQIGKAEQLKPMELELRRLEDLTEAIVNDFTYMRAREEEMRDTNGTLLTFFTLTYLSLSLLQNQLTPEYYISAFSQWDAYYSWRVGRYSISDDSSRLRN